MTAKALTFKNHSVIPGFGITLGFTLFYMGIIVMIPLAGLVFKTLEMSWADFVETIFNRFVISGIKIKLLLMHIGLSANTIMPHNNLHGNLM